MHFIDELMYLLPPYLLSPIKEISTSGGKIL